MRTVVQRLVIALSLTIVSALFTPITPNTAHADTFPALRWPAVASDPYSAGITSGESGGITIGCNDRSSTLGLTTYNASGTVIRHIPRSNYVDGVQNCIRDFATDSDGDIYGVPFGKTTNGSWEYGPNILAYDGNTLKWKYPIFCSPDQSAEYTVGADGNIYATTWLDDGLHLIGLAPDLEAGQTQPNKILDVKVPDDCSIQLTAYKEGIMLHGYSTSAMFYSYGGKLLGETRGDINFEELNADGLLFTSHSVQGSFQSMTVSAFDPRKGMTVWTAQVSSPGADAEGVYNLKPMPGGGAVMFVFEQKMISDSIPASPAEYVYTMVVLNGNGQKIKSVQLPNHDTEGNQYNDFSIQVDNSGKFVVTRELIRDWSPLGVVYGVFDSNGNTTGQGGTIVDDVDDNNESIYSLSYGGTDDFTIGVETLFLFIRCSGDCAYSGTHLYPIHIDGLGVSYPFGEIMAANTALQPSLKKYVALGDSFSSGEGVEPFYEETASPGYSECHRSLLAYAPLLGRNPYTALSLDQDSFRACSGAETNHIINDSQNDYQDPQYYALDSSTEVVSITIGGNDIDFIGFATACVSPISSCRIGSNAHTTSLNKINNELQELLMLTYQRVLSEAPNADIYVLGYPHVVQKKYTTDPIDARCSYLYDGGYDSTGTIPQYWGDAQAARDIVTHLNEKIAESILAVRQLDPSNNRLHYVEINEEDSPFKGHEICSVDESYFQNIDQAIDNKAYVFHPNKDGHEAYAEILERELIQ